MPTTYFTTKENQMFISKLLPRCESVLGGIPMSQNLHLNTLKKLTWLVTSVLVVAALFAPPVYADERDTSVFDTLRADILMFVPEVYQRSFLAKVEAVELLLPPNPCVPPNPCASFNILIALRNENQAVSGTNGYLERDAAVIDADIAELLDAILPPNPC
jgi:hypothetical protein